MQPTEICCLVVGLADVDVDPERLTFVDTCRDQRVIALGAIDARLANTELTDVGTVENEHSWPVVGRAHGVTSE
jgi:hypothetical protein